jgi:hypothetical protein
MKTVVVWDMTPSNVLHIYPAVHKISRNLGASSNSIRQKGNIT